MIHGHPGLHPMGETVKMVTAWLGHSLMSHLCQVNRMRGRGRREARRSRSAVPARPPARPVQGIELGRRAIAQGRVQALLVVDLVDEGADAACRLAMVAIEPAVDLLGLQRLHEA